MQRQSLLCPNPVALTCIDEGCTVAVCIRGFRTLRSPGLLQEHQVPIEIMALLFVKRKGKSLLQRVILHDSCLRVSTQYSVSEKLIIKILVRQAEAVAASHRTASEERVVTAPVDGSI